ncbi:MAG: GGDEF domain-containing protein [Saccharofermentans sp.]|nr:GGDEF domain-containing protein [Saccharofermentans sp.]
MYEKLITFIKKDVTGENESNRVSYIVRINGFIMSLYFFIWMLGFGINNSVLGFSACALCFAINVLASYFTYQNKNATALTIYAGGIIMWMVLFVIRWGWDGGVQHYLFVMLLLVFVGTYASTRIKLVECVVLYGIRLFLFMWHLNHEAIEPLSKEVSIVIQNINMIAIYISMIVILFIFTNDKMVTEAKLASYNRELKFKSQSDTLTGLPNRSAVMETLTDTLLSGKSTNGVCVAIGDIDFFKKVNDTYGHEAGDEVLKTLAKRFNIFMQNKGIAARWGGEEFLFVFLDDNLDDAALHLENLLTQVRGIVIPYNNQLLKVTMTIGVSDINAFVYKDTDSEDIENRIYEAISAADKKLYIGKQNGRNTLIV